MKVIVDTSVWSLALRRRAAVADIATARLSRLVADGRVLLLGAVRRELLSGIRDREVFDSLRERLRGFPDLALDVGDHETAAEFFNACRRNGVQGSNTDFLICAAADRRGCAILTTDKDFGAFAAHVPVRLESLLDPGSPRAACLTSRPVRAPRSCGIPARTSRAPT